MNKWTKVVVDVGGTVDITAVLTVEDALIDAASVILRVKSPGGIVTTPVISRDSIGTYHCDLEVDTAGEWFYRFEATAPASAHEGSFLVRQSHVLA
jgi:hypothetical protein